MKAKIKKTGEIINLSPSTSLTLNICDSWGNPIVLKPEEIELIQDKTDSFDWQSFRAEAAKDILCAMINHFGTSQLDVNESVIWADILIEKLKEKEEK